MSWSSPIDLDLLETPPGAPVWVTELKLHMSDKDRIEDGDWLQHQHISAAQSLLRKQFPSQTGLQDTIVLAQKLSWNSRVEDFIQIVNISNNHWVCVTNINCPPDTIDVYDSMYATPSKTLLLQVGVIVRCQQDTFTVRMIDMQRQNGGLDCALFATSVATSLCFGEDPAEHHKDQGRMREHLISCFENQRMTLFPDSSKPLRRLRNGRIKGDDKEVKVHCVCRLPRINGTPLGNMAQCKKCKKWFHQKCMTIPDRVFSDRSWHWFCTSCN